MLRKLWQGETGPSVQWTGVSASNPCPVDRVLASLDPLLGCTPSIVELRHPRNLSRPVARVVTFYNQRGKAEPYINEGKNAIKWTRLSCRKFRDNAIRLQLHALAYDLGNFMRTLALPKR